MADETASGAGAPQEGKAGEVSRRRFLNYAWKGLAAGLVVEAGWTTYDILHPQPSSAFGGIISAGNTSAYPSGTVQYFLDGRCYVASAEGGLVALYQKCPHLGCKVPFNPQTCRFECPCHGSKYNIRGEYLAGPAPRGMDRFLIKIQGGEVLVDTSRTIEGPPRGEVSLKHPPQSGCTGGSGTGASP